MQPVQQIKINRESQRDNLVNNSHHRNISLFCPYNKALGLNIYQNNTTYTVNKFKDKFIVRNNMANLPVLNIPRRRHRPHIHAQVFGGRGNTKGNMSNTQQM